MKILTSALVAGCLAAGAANAAQIDFTTSDFASTFPQAGDPASTANVTIGGVEFTITASARGTDGFRQSFDDTGLSFGLPGNGMTQISIVADSDVTYTDITGEDRTNTQFSEPQLGDLLLDGVVVEDNFSFADSFATLNFDDISVTAGQTFVVAADFSPPQTYLYNPIFALFVLGSLGFEVADEPVDPTTPVPLPAGLPLLLAGLGALGIAKRRKG